ncbi:hypothetical protein OsJ_00274 [Oryza sativa Japonica Group]|uniref:Uncharacterized protein n=1 Tax=Oryza sativa subsp. japonica TaxID=39947 RepID=A2ZNZ4_ORYSJ|nr:hypothetical protein OsJ_00274 [Oryza sativa Japonica Group]
MPRPATPHPCAVAASDLLPAHVPQPAIPFPERAAADKLLTMLAMISSPRRRPSSGGCRRSDGDDRLRAEQRGGRSGGGGGGQKEEEVAGEHGSCGREVNDRSYADKIAYYLLQIIDQVQNYVVKGVDVKNQNSVVMASQVDVAAFSGRCLHAYAIDIAA